MTSRPPIFIIGSPRSGTTLLRLMVTSHPAIVVPPECGFALWWREKYGDWKQRDPRLDAFLQDLASSRKFETWKMDLDQLRGHLQGNSPASYAELVSAIYTFFGLTNQPTATRWGDKNNYYLAHIPELHALFPHALFVHIVRDGRDVCCSYRQLQSVSQSSPYAPQLPVEPEKVAAEWTKNIASIREAFSAFSWNGVHEIRYEDLVVSPETELRRLCAFLGEPFDLSMLAYSERNRRDGLEPPEFLAWKRLTLDPPSVTQVGRFRRDLNANEIAEFEAVSASTLAQYNYL
jgi:hypothetical protein